MTTETVMDIAQEALWLIVTTVAPCLLVTLVVGLIVSIFQTVTSIHEQTLTFVPKILATFLMLLLIGGWMLDNLSTFMEVLWSAFGEYVP
ncbi:MAG: flagellar biosynthesis protein FliQ [Lachnospiraceae bacterium]|nr:flagellar biosynthesis protein FliQ [Lachnospiraceae bacterium]